jgi:hypothetical protein
MQTNSTGFYADAEALILWVQSYAVCKAGAAVEACGRPANVAA